MSPKNIIQMVPLILIPFEATFFSIPFFFITSMLLYILKPQVGIVLVAFLGSIVLDILRVMPVGSTALALFSAFLLVEIMRGEVIFTDYKLATIFIFIASFGYGKIFQYSDNILIYAIIFSSVYLFISYFYRRSSWLK